ncbi:hypothetical protein JB92DRAFT_2841998, partial [Gautieria morchelliformis]
MSAQVEFGDCGSLFVFLSSISVEPVSSSWPAADAITIVRAPSPNRHPMFSCCAPVLLTFPSMRPSPTTCHGEGYFLAQRIKYLSMLLPPLHVFAPMD